MNYFLYILLTAAASVAIAFSSFFMKKAAECKTALSYLKNGSYWCSMLLLCVSMALQLYLHRKLEYSVMIPLLSLQSVWAALISRFILKEKINAKTLVGIGLIVTGAVVLALS